MYCTECGNKFEEGGKFCRNCGSKISDHKSKNSEKNNTKEQSTKVKKKDFKSHWFLWWVIEDKELEYQIQNYNTLKITESARGISSLLLIFSGVVTLLFVLFDSSQEALILDVIILCVLAFFSYSGSKLAFLAAMIYWTFAKLVSLIDFSTLELIGNPVVQIIWWAIFMHAFYLAWEVESNIE